MIQTFQDFAGFQFLTWEMRATTTYNERFSRLYTSYALIHIINSQGYHTYLYIYIPTSKYLIIDVN